MQGQCLGDEPSAKTLNFQGPNTEARKAYKAWRDAGNKPPRTDPYFVPSGTPVFTQLQFFQENRQRMGLVVDEYGEVLGLLTLEDIIEEIIGEFTTSAPGGEGDAGWNELGEAMVEGSTPLRELNRRFGTGFPLDGPKTLNGLILETLQDLPDGNVSVRFGHVAAEVLQIQGRAIRGVRLHKLGDPASGPQAQAVPPVA